MYKEILIGEYANYFIHNDGKVSTYDNNKLSTYNQPAVIETGSAGHPWACLISKTGTVYHALGDNTQWKPVPIENAASSTSYYTHHVVVGRNGSLIAYTDDLKIIGLQAPGVIKKAVGAAVLMVMDKDGLVYKYNWISSGKFIKPHADLAKLIAERIVLPGPATDIATSRSFFSAAIIEGKLWVWCDGFGAPFIGQKAATKPVCPNWKVNATGMKLKNVWASDNCLYILDGNDEIWAMGNNWVGQVGNGVIDPRVLAGNADMGNRLFIPEPVNISRGLKWKQIFVGTYYAFRTMAESMAGNIYSWGYGKFGLLANGIRPQDDPTNVGITAITKPHRATIPASLTVVSTADLKSGKVAYPPKEPRILIKTTMTRYYDDGTDETETV